MWEHFEKYADSDGAPRARCKYCSSNYAANTSYNVNSTLNAHLRKCKQNPHNVETSQAKIGFQQASKDHKGGVSMSIWRFDQELCMKALAKTIILDEQPFSFVEKEGFRYFVSVAQPQFRILSRTIVTRDCLELFSEEKARLKHFLIENNQSVCLTIDTWTSIQRINYLCLTAHFIDKDWKLHKRILNICPVNSHKGGDMAIAITKCLLDWGLDKVFMVTIDNASSNNITVKELSKQFSKWGTNLMDGHHLHVRCMAHVIDLIVEDCLKEIGDSVRRVRQAVRYIRQLLQG